MLPHPIKPEKRRKMAKNMFLLIIKQTQQIGTNSTKKFCFLKFNLVFFVWFCYYCLIMMTSLNSYVFIYLSYFSIKRE